jgi:valyl-tRNA synthetase
MLEAYPTYDESLSFEQEEEDFGKIIAAIKGVRNIRSEMNVVPSVKAKLYIETEQAEIFRSGLMFFERLASASEVEISAKVDIPDTVTVVTDCARIFIPLSDIVDTEKERARLDKEKKKVLKDIDFLSSKLNNQGFLAKAPEQLIAAQKEKLAKAEEKLAKIEQSIAALK